ncbi:MAG: CDP-alcohol phosphatidyltransferase family protein [Prevotella sp.]|nr:CDP-alcohol phosphatidyltransferase family protein [Bacteroides sp.]MCM1366001.1 CDP-alcohol phosphatidyltransferase family protein [Prevotella sp.]MCM1436929.1 CDP-alcohol phosphatidyltransferase family protein [Prevotella sp.]
MINKSTFKSLRNSLQQGIYFVINPLVHLLIKMGVTPNMVTFIGLLGQIAGAALLIVAGWKVMNGGDSDYILVTVSGGVIIAFSLFDMLDGQVARLGKMESRFGAMFDSVLDRYCELATLGGISYYLFETGSLVGALVTFLALVGSIMVSYTRARAEGLGLECKIGFMQRPERVVVTCVSLLATGITGMCMTHSQAGFNPDWILTAGMTIIALFANITAIARLNHCRKQLQ